MGIPTRTARAMDDPRLHITAAARRSAAETQLLLATMMRRTWPASSDGTVPAARHWVRAWGPARGILPGPLCACPARCASCN